MALPLLVTFGDAEGAPSLWGAFADRTGITLFPVRRRVTFIDPSPPR